MHIMHIMHRNATRKHISEIEPSGQVLSDCANVHEFLGVNPSGSKGLHTVKPPISIHV